MYKNSDEKIEKVQNENDLKVIMDSKISFREQKWMWKTGTWE